MDMTTDTDKETHLVTIRTLENHLRIVCAELEATQLRLEVERQRHETTKDTNAMQDLVTREQYVHIEDKTCIIS